MEASLATAVRNAPTKESPAPVVSTAFTENPFTLPLKFCSQTVSPKMESLDNKQYHYHNIKGSAAQMRVTDVKSKS